MINVKNLTITARMTHGTKTIVDGLFFSAPEGEALGIVGQSGCGKTMTALSVFGLLPENCLACGNADINGIDTINLPERKLALLRGQNIVYMPQSGADFLNPSLKVRTHFYETLRRLGVQRNNWSEVSLSLLRTAGFVDPGPVLGKYPFQLSGGMAQRVVLALGMAGRPSLVIADEPTRGIDRSTAVAFIEMLKASFADAVLIIITHDISITKLCDKLLVMHDGTMAEYGPAEDVIRYPTSIHTKQLIEAMPERWGQNN